MTSVNKRFSGFVVRQRHEGPAFFVFAAPAREVISWATVDRVHERQGGIQRRLNAARRRSVQRFFTEHAINVVPTSTILAFRPGAAMFVPSELQPSHAAGVEFGEISFDFDASGPEHGKPAFVVDGQHRLFGMGDVQNEELPVLISALIDADINEQAFQFIVINNKASKVPPDLVKSILADLNEDDLDRRLRGVRIALGGKASLVALVDEDDDSPLREMVDWDRRRGTGVAAIKPAAIEGAVNYVRRNMISIAEDEDAVLELFFAMWRGIRGVYPDLFEHPMGHNLFANAGFRAFTELLVDELGTLAASDFVDIENTVEVAEFSARLANHIPEEFWRSDWVLKSLDTSAGREIIQADLRRIRQNIRDGGDWSSNLALLAASAS